MDSICFVANKYPNDVDKNGLVFVQQLVWTIADLGTKCTVICPIAANLNPRLLKLPYHLTEKTENNSEVDVFFPKFFGLGQSHYIFGKSPAPITTTLFTRAVLKTIRKNDISVDAVYGHFAAPAGVCAARIGRVLGIPSFMAHGESTSWSIDQFGQNKMKDEFSSLAGVVAVSGRNRDLLIEKDVVDGKKIRVFPNGYRPERFYQMSKARARQKLGWNEGLFVVGMVGSLIERKGPLRLQTAVEKLDNVYFACAGKGDQTPGGERCLYAGPINNDELVYFYNALDIFVLPTLNEGCCNAIVEAIACGCPVISSDLPFNYDICDDTNSVLVNPKDVDEISSAINRLMTNPEERLSFSRGSIEKAKSLTLRERARSILSFINSLLLGMDS